uniref:EOG090X0J8E n=1 Tax=Megafenestra aurita TaxID=2291010 RepID=A0A4Y7NKB7_9CRUS|nr:EOG090X0J8E [Megafenestra aurita]SVE92775.1 EOG090X0J8E [Megafenestra aurita]
MESSTKEFSVGVESTYDVKDVMLFGVSKNRALDSISSGHPLEAALIKHAQKKEEIDMRMLRTMQGLHAPIRLHMEKLGVKDIGHLPCLHRHNALLDALTGKDTTLDFEDFLNNPQDSEIMGQPHVMIERHLGML